MTGLLDHIFSIFCWGMCVWSKVKQVEILRKILDLFCILRLCQSYSSAQFLDVVRGKRTCCLCQRVEILKTFMLHIQQHIHFIWQLTVLHPEPGIRRILDSRPLENTVNFLLRHREI